MHNVTAFPPTILCLQFVISSVNRRKEYGLGRSSHICKSVSPLRQHSIVTLFHCQYIAVGICWQVWT